MTSGDGRFEPSATLEVLRARADLLERIRAFFRARGVLEVETPALSRRAVTDVHLASFSTRYRGPGAPADGIDLHLVTSPGAIGTGHGRAGAIVGLVLGAVGLFLARRALVRSSRYA